MQPQTDEEVAEMIARFRTPPGIGWEDLRNDIITLLKSRRQLWAAANWQPIATAPKDGSALLLWLSRAPDRNYTVQDTCDNHAIGFWGHGRWLSIEVEDCGSMGGEMTGWMPDWCSIDLHPTHWMPLPASPQQ